MSDAPDPRRRTRLARDRVHMRRLVQPLGDARIARAMAVVVAGPVEVLVPGMYKGVAGSEWACKSGTRQQQPLLPRAVVVVAACIHGTVGDCRNRSLALPADTCGRTIGVALGAGSSRGPRPPLAEGVDDLHRTPQPVTL
jgi:hypothetical protein